MTRGRQPGAAGRRRARRLHLGRARPAARGGGHRHRGHHRHLGGGDERGGAEARLGARAATRARGRRSTRFWLRLAGLDGFMSEAVIDWLRAVSPSPRRHRPRARGQPGGDGGRGDHPGALALPVQPGELPSAARRSSTTCSTTAPVCSAEGPQLFVSATHVRDRQAAGLPGRGDHHRRDPRLRLPADALPGGRDRRPAHRPARGLLGRRLHGQPGALSAVLPHHGCPDIVIVHINPLVREELPRTATEILNRINEISFNASLLRELRAIDFVNRLIEPGTIAKGAMKRELHPFGARRRADEPARHRHQDDPQQGAAAAAQGRRPRGDGRLPRRARRQTSASGPRSTSAAMFSWEGSQV